MNIIQIIAGQNRVFPLFAGNHQLDEMSWPVGRPLTSLSKLNLQLAASKQSLRRSESRVPSPEMMMLLFLLEARPTSSAPARMRHLPVNDIFLSDIIIIISGSGGSALNLIDGATTGQQHLRPPSAKIANDLRRWLRDCDGGGGGSSDASASEMRGSPLGSARLAAALYSDGLG